MSLTGENLKTNIIFISLLFVLVATGNVYAKLSTDIKFDGQLVGGKTQSPFESMAVVENEKKIDQLIGMRTSFSDRTKKAQGMR